MNTASLLLSVVFGAIGMAYFVYGKRQQRLMPLLAGAGLCVYTFFVSGALPTLGVGAVLTALPFLIAL